MTQRYPNPFAAINLVYPIEQRQDYERYCRRSNRESISKSPFPRMVDLWFAGLSLAAGTGLRPVDLSSQQTSNFNTGVVLDTDSWRIQAVMLMAIAAEDDVAVVEHPNRMMAIANGLAAAGVPRVVVMLKEGNDEPIWNISEAVCDLLGDGLGD